MEETAMQTKTGEATTAQDYNRNKYYIENSTELTEAEKIRMAKDLLNLESQGVIEWCDGAWRLVPGVEIEESPDGPVARFREARRLPVCRQVAGKNRASADGSIHSTMTLRPCQTAPVPLIQLTRKV
jgi:hypothetical protein